jgi:DNA repair exonuclease SbcCD ATPase subunit
MVAAGSMLTAGVFAADEQAKAADDAKALQMQLREAKATLSNYERGRWESPAVRAAKDALAKAQADEKAQAEADLKAKPESAEVLKKIADVETQRKDVDTKAREVLKSIEANAELVAMKKKVDEAQAAWKAKYEELVKASAALADINKVKESANTAIGEANAKLIQIRLAGNKEVEALKAKIAELEAKVALLAPPAKAHKKSETAPASEKKAVPAGPAAK